MISAPKNAALGALPLSTTLASILAPATHELGGAVWMPGVNDAAAAAASSISSLPLLRSGSVVSRHHFVMSPSTRIFFLGAPPASSSALATEVALARGVFVDALPLTPAGFVDALLLVPVVLLPVLVLLPFPVALFLVVGFWVALERGAFRLPGGFPPPVCLGVDCDE